MAEIVDAITRAGTVPVGGTATELLQVVRSENVCLTVTNADPANALTLAVYRSALGGSFAPDTPSSSTIAANSSALLEWSYLGCAALQLVLTGVAGTPYSIELSGKG